MIYMIYAKYNLCDLDRDDLSRVLILYFFLEGLM